MYHSSISANEFFQYKDLKNFESKINVLDGGVHFYGDSSIEFKNKTHANGCYWIQADRDLFRSDPPNEVNNSSATLKNVHFAPTWISCSLPTAKNKGYFNVVGTVDLSHLTILVVECYQDKIHAYEVEKRILFIQATTPIKGKPKGIYARRTCKDKDGNSLGFDVRLEIDGNKAYIILSKKY